MPSLHTPPDGYHSTHGVPADISPSDFVAEEFVVYNPTQIQIKYLVECRPVGQAIEKINLGSLDKAQITWAPPSPPKELPPDSVISGLYYVLF